MGGIRFDNNPKKKTTFIPLCNECEKVLYNEEVGGYISLDNELILYCMKCYETVEKWEMMIALRK